VDGYIAERSTGAAESAKTEPGNPGRSIDPLVVDPSRLVPGDQSREEATLMKGNLQGFRERVMYLASQGNTYQQIGIILAREQNRAVPYQAKSIADMMRRSLAKQDKRFTNALADMNRCWRKLEDADRLELQARRLRLDPQRQPGIIPDHFSEDEGCGE
jgi:hypothetical protein